MAACGNDASRSWTAARLANSSASRSAIRTSRAPASVVAVSSNMSSARRDLDGHRHAVGDHVVDGRARLGPLDDLAELLRRRVAADPERDPDLLEAVAGLVVDAERAAHVHFAG